MISFDPRPDLGEDSAIWNELLMLALGRDGNGPDSLYGTLHGLRCEGARLEVGATRATIARPADMPTTTWQDLRQRWLIPKALVITELLTALVHPRSG